MKSRPASVFIKPLLTLAFPVLMAVNAQAAIINHLDVDFNDYPLGPLTTAGTSFTGISNATGVTSSYTVESLSATDRVLHVVKSGGTSSVTLRTTPAPDNPTGTQELKITANSSYVWSFDFQAPTTPDQGAFFRLDDGAASAGRYIAGLRLSGGTISYLTNPNTETLTSQMTAIPTDVLSVQAGVWYEVSFSINSFSAPGANPANVGLSYDFTITRRGESEPAFSTSVVNLMPSALKAIDPGYNNSVRMGMSFTGSTIDNDFYLDNIRLRTIPEPGVSLLMISGLGVGVWMTRRRLARHTGKP
ncbi:MAG TPA: hypothetical protein VNQ90_00640 [Chthoniobacteraceae bacterium]|nr:hypothetical protein [Chthoniobacteraceae bacterium]